MKKSINAITTSIIIISILFSTFVFSSAIENDRFFSLNRDYTFHNWDNQQGIYNGFSYFIYSDASVKVPPEINGNNSFATVFAYNNPNTTRHEWATTINIPNNINGVPVKYIGDPYGHSLWEAFEINIPEGVIGISNYTFSATYSKRSNNGEFIKKINLPLSLQYIGTSAFSGVDYVVLPDCQLSYIGARAFDGIGNTEITIPKKVTSISEKAFEDCHNLKKIEFLGESISISNRAFIGTSIENIVGENIEYFDCDFCETFKDLYNNATQPIIIGKVFIAYKKGFNKTYSVPNGIQTINPHAFENTDIESIHIPITVKMIGESAFKSCYSLKNVELNDGIEYINNQAFYECISLSDINFPNSLTSIGDSCFYYCKSLKSLTLPAPLSYIGDSAFNSCYSLESIKINDGIEYIGNQAFYECIALSDINIPNSITEINDSCFYHCKALKSLTLPDSLTVIGDNSFKDCLNLFDIKFPENLEKVGSLAFAGCPIEECIIKSKNIDIQSSGLGYILTRYEDVNDSNENLTDFPYSPNPSFTLKGYSGTGVEAYATSNGFTFVSLEDSSEQLLKIGQNANSQSQISSFVIFFIIIIAVCIFFFLIKKYYIDKQKLKSDDG